MNNKENVGTIVFSFIVFLLIIAIISFTISKAIETSYTYNTETKEKPKTLTCLEYKEVEYIKGGNGINLPVYLLTSSITMGILTAEKPSIGTRKECIKWSN